MPWIVPAIVAMTMTPIAQREIVSVTRSQTVSQRSSSPGRRTLVSARLRFPTSVSRKRHVKRIVKLAMKTVKKPPAIPSTDEIASGIETDICSAPSWTFPAAPVSPSHDESSSDARSSSTSSGSSWRKSRTLPTSGTSRSRSKAPTRSAVPRTVTVAARPRDIRVLSITKRTGYSKTKARKIPTKTIRNVSPMAANATMTPIAAATSRTVRMGRISSIRRDSRDSIAETLGSAAVGSG